VNAQAPPRTEACDYWKVPTSINLFWLLEAASMPFATLANATMSPIETPNSLAFSNSLSAVTARL